MTIQKIADKLPDEMSEKDIQELIKRNVFEGSILLYKAVWVKNKETNKGESKVKVTCSACGKTFYRDKVPLNGCHLYNKETFGFYDAFEIDTVYSGQSCVCPLCGANGKAVRTTRFGSSPVYIISRIFPVTMHNIGGNFVLCQYCLDKYINKDGKVGYISQKYDAVALCDGKISRISGHVNEMYGSFVSRGKWIPVSKFDDELGFVNSNEIIISENKIFESNAEKSALETYCKDGGLFVAPATYLRIWNKYPNIENLVRTGYSDYLSDLFHILNSTPASYANQELFVRFESLRKKINIKLSRPNEMLGLSKDEYKYLKGLTVREIDLYKHEKDNGTKVEIKHIKAAKEKGLLNNYSLLVNDVLDEYNLSLIRLLNYAEKIKYEFNLITFRDYLCLVKEYYGKVPQEMMFPKKLKEAHDQINAQVKVKRDEIMNRKITEVAKKWEKFCFEDKETGLIIRPARSQDEIINEGNKLSHCVARYAKDVSNEKTMIFFIRKLKKPNEPFFTLEYNNGKVQQNRGKQNCSRTNKVILFESKWLEYIRNMKGNKNYGNANREKVNA